MIASSHNSDRSRTAPHPGARQLALEWLMGRINYERIAVIPYQERQLKLDCMRQLLTRLGQPDAGMKIIHVAGTKGKGSTSAMIAAVLTAAGYRTGLFSSPHLERIEERLAVDGQPCSSDEFVALVNRLIPIVRALDDEAAADGDPTGGPTYFDITTAMSLVHFVERQADAAVLEVGLGGRLDSTNVCLPVVSVITSISFDHMRQLGNTLASIAREKAGIIKPGVPVICGVTDPEPQAVIAQLAREHGCRLIQLGRDFHFEYERPGRPRPRSSEYQGKTRSGDRMEEKLGPCCPVKSALNIWSPDRNFNYNKCRSPCPAGIRRRTPPSPLPRFLSCAIKDGVFRATRCGSDCRMPYCRAASKLCRASRQLCSIRHTIRRLPERSWIPSPSCLPRHAVR